MDKLLFASARPGAGKTSMAMGMALGRKEKVAYMKPFGDRLLYRKKRLWDHDAALFVNVLGLPAEADAVTIAFDHSKVRYMYDEKAIKERLYDSVRKIEKEILIIEGGRDLSYGASVHLDALSVAKSVGAKVVLVLSGPDDAVVDDAVFLKRRLDMSGVDLAGVVVNKSPGPESFRETHLPEIEQAGLRVLGVVPRVPELSRITMDYLAEMLFAKVLAGEESLGRTAHNVFVGAMSAETAMRTPLWKAEKKLLITAGDRNDLLLAALDEDVAGIVATNNLQPNAKVLAKADGAGVPVLLVPSDTFSTAKQIDAAEPLVSKDDAAKLDALKAAVERHVDLTGVLSG